MMRAVRNVTDAGPAALELAEIAPPERAPGEVLVSVHAAGLAYPDVLQSRSAYQRRFARPFTLGSEFAGTVVAADTSAGFAPGDRVLGVVGAGAFADLVAAPADRVLPLPDGIDFVQAGALPINVLSADFILRERAELRRGETVLIHGAAGGLGLELTRQATRAGARVLAVVSTAEKAARARAAGADAAIAPDGFLAEARRLTDGRGVDLVLDPVGGDRFTDSLRALATRGRLVVIGFTGGEIPTVKVNRLLLTNTTVIGAAWEGLMERSSVSLPAQWERIAPEIAAGRPLPSVDRVIALDEVPAALTALDERRASGKTVARLR